MQKFIFSLFGFSSLVYGLTAFINSLPGYYIYWGYLSKVDFYQFIFQFLSATVGIGLLTRKSWVIKPFQVLLVLQWIIAVRRTSLVEVEGQLKFLILAIVAIGTLFYMYTLYLTKQSNNFFENSTFDNSHKKVILTIVISLVFALIPTINNDKSLTINPMPTTFKSELFNSSSWKISILQPIKVTEKGEIKFEEIHLKHEHIIYSKLINGKLILDNIFVFRPVQFIFNSNSLELEIQSHKFAGNITNNSILTSLKPITPTLIYTRKSGFVSGEIGITDLSKNEVILYTRNLNIYGRTADMILKLKKIE